MLGGGSTRWTEGDSRTFVDYGDLFVPDREAHLDAMRSVVDPRIGSGDVVDLCCGDGTLAQAILERHPRCRVYGLDGSPLMLQRARVRLAGAGFRFRSKAFELGATEWRGDYRDCAAVVSSLAVHHLRAEEKQALFRDIAAMLATSGVFVLTDVMLPISRQGLSLAARQWDDAVRRRSQERFGDERGVDAFRVQEWNAFRFPDTEVDHLSTVGEHLNWLNAAGFGPVDLLWANAGHVILAATKA